MASGRDAHRVVVDERRLADHHLVPAAAETTHQPAHQQCASLKKEEEEWASEQQRRATTAVESYAAPSCRGGPVVALGVGVFKPTTRARNRRDGGRPVVVRPRPAEEEEVEDRHEHAERPPVDALAVALVEQHLGRDVLGRAAERIPGADERRDGTHLCWTSDGTPFGFRAPSTGGPVSSASPFRGPGETHKKKKKKRKEERVKKSTRRGRRHDVRLEDHALCESEVGDLDVPREDVA